MNETHNRDREVETRDAWKRGLHMLLFMIAFGVGQVVLNLMTVVQFLWLLFTGAPNGFLRRFGVTLGAWLRQVAEFQSCASDEKPFPWKEWPQAL